MINAAIVGLGGWARVLVNSVQGKSDKIRFTAGMTRTVSKAADYAAEKGFPLSDDYAEILADPAIDAVVLSTPHSQHAEQIVQASAAGKHVFVEKPFTLTKVSAEESVAAADAAGVVLALGHNRRFMPSWTELKNRIDSGSLGTIMHVETNMSGLGALSFQTGGWRADRAESPAGGMAGMGIHMIDTLVGLCGPITDVHCLSQRRVLTVDVDDTTSMLFRFDSGITGYLGTIAATTATQRVQVFGSEGTAEIRQERYFEARPMKGEAETIDFGFFDKERAELDAFAGAITGDAPYPLPNEQAIHGVAVFEAIMEAAISGDTVAVG
ncbi:MAG: Gfo/Idh/MocA family oxidoreductase [Rhodospirillaceae bacterium]|nr:Gfo/Idh/MocA family oxidoreductase [Rhodospirillaceae bacterium]